MLDPQLRAVIAAAFAWKALCLFLVLVYGVVFDLTISGMLTRWDGGNYLQIALHGYANGSLLNAFFPLLPIVLFAATSIASIYPIFVALFVCNAISCLAIIFLARWFSLTAAKPEDARMALLLAFAFPGNIFFHFIYSEGLFLLLSLGMIASLNRNRAACGYLSGFCLPLARPEGILLFIIPVAYSRIASRSTTLWTMFGFAAGYSFYLGIMSVFAGDPFAGYHAQDQYAAKATIFRLMDPIGVLHALVHFTFEHTETESFLDRLVFLLAVATLPAWFNRDRRIFLLTACMVFVPAITTNFYSFSRHVMLAFPVFLILAEKLRGRRVTSTVFLGCLFVWQLLLLFRYVSGLWAG